MKEDAQKATVRSEEAAASRPPFRFWMTGCMAVVMSAFAGSTLARSDARGMVCHVSRYSVEETVQRIEASAQRHGLQMFALVERKSQAAGASGSDQSVTESTTWQVVVLASSEGGTPVLMDRPGGQHAVPMSLVVRPTADGGSEVLLGSATSQGSLAALPGHVKRDLAEIPELVADALR